MVFSFDKGIDRFNYSMNKSQGKSPPFFTSGHRKMILVFDKFPDLKQI